VGEVMEHHVRHHPVHHRVGHRELLEIAAQEAGADLPGVSAVDEGRDRRTGAPRPDVLELARRLQQFTGPVAAKGVEDTACYRYPRLLSLGEVGDDPRRFGVPVREFHARNQEQAALHPHGMITTSTHDTKRGEDVRARLNVLSEMPSAFGDRVRTWMRLTAAWQTAVDGDLVPTPGEQYFLHQTLLGSWPAELTGVATLPAAPLAAYCERVAAYFVKALREAKERTSWRHPNPAHEAAAVDFVRALLDGDGRSNPFLEDFLPFQWRVAVLGAINGLSQLLLKLTAPGVPDTYQGTEAWDLRSPIGQPPPSITPGAST
jgi:(1->4)-alpha-D-glucan 1-alpha-D-glucosylmutase